MLLSIITIHFNQLDGLRETMASLQHAGGDAGFEWIVVDGGTVARTDPEKAVVEAAQERADYFVSEPDEGIYDAMNKGVQCASGEYLLFLNAGDCLHPMFDQQRLEEIAQSHKPDMIWGQSWDKQGDSDGQGYPTRTRAPSWLRWGPVTAHQAIVFRREGLGKAPYDNSLKIAADYDLICRIYRQGGRIVRESIPICIYRLDGKSARDTGATMREESLVRGRHFDMPSWLNRLLTTSKHLLWRISRRFPGFRRSMRQRV